METTETMSKFIARAKTLYQEAVATASSDSTINEQLESELSGAVTEYLRDDNHNTLVVAAYVIAHDAAWQYSESDKQYRLNADGGDNPTLKQFLWWYLWSKITQGG